MTSPNFLFSRGEKKTKTRKFKRKVKFAVDLAREILSAVNPIVLLATLLRALRLY